MDGIASDLLFGADSVTVPVGGNICAIDTRPLDVCREKAFVATVDIEADDDSNKGCEDSEDFMLQKRVETSKSLLILQSDGQVVELN